MEGTEGRAALGPMELLAEREKELACIYSICLLAAGASEPRAAARGIARALCAAMRWPARVSCVVSFTHAGQGVEIVERRGRDLRSGRAASVLDASLPPGAAGGWEGGVRLEYADEGFTFLPQERSLAESVMTVAASILRTASLIADLRAMTESLSSKNAALREILSYIEEERRRGLDEVRSWIDLSILPLAERAREEALPHDRRDSYLELLVAEARRGAPGLGNPVAAPPSLSPREREISLQIRNGRTSKEIAALLGISSATVERHRHNIRRKLGLVDSEANLAGVLGGDIPPRTM